MDLCAYWFFFCIFVNMMIFHIKFKYIKIDPQSYIPLNLYLKIKWQHGITHLQRIFLNVPGYLHNCDFFAFSEDRGNLFFTCEILIFLKQIFSGMILVLYWYRYRTILQSLNATWPIYNTNTYRYYTGTSTVLIYQHRTQIMKKIKKNFIMWVKVLKIISVPYCTRWHRYHTIINHCTVPAKIK